MTKLPHFDAWKPVTREEGKRDVGPGWAPLLDPLFDYCETHGVKVLQVKEKFGGLRFYTDHNDPALEALVDEAEDKALGLCEWCGAPGSLRQGGWIKTLCDAHHVEWEQDKRWWG